MGATDQPQHVAWSTFANITYSGTLSAPRLVSYSSYSSSTTTYSTPDYGPDPVTSLSPNVGFRLSLLPITYLPPFHQKVGSTPSKVIRPALYVHIHLG
jgi:hypothetical protein